MQRVRSLWFFFAALMLPAQGAYVVPSDLRQECEALRERVLQAPREAEARFEYAACLSLMGLIEQSRAELRPIRRIDPEFKTAALPRYLERHRKNPDDPRHAYRLGLLYYVNERFDEALHYFGEVEKRQPAGQINVWARAFMAAIQGERGDWETAEILVRQSLQAEPEAYFLHLMHAAALKGKGRYFAALQAYNGAGAYKNDVAPLAPLPPVRKKDR